MNRRNFIQVGGLGCLGLTFSDILRAQASYDGPAPKVKSVINIFLPGGIAVQESWDPKPNAPVEYRGPFSAIDTSANGIQLSELFPNVAKIMNKATIIRSMTHGEAAHERGTHNMFTGWKPSPALQYPAMGSVVSHELGVRNNIPAYISIPNQANEFDSTGFISTKHSTFSLGSDPADPNFKVRDLTLPDNITIDRFARRKGLLETVDSRFKNIAESDNVSAIDEFYQRAYNLISSDQAISAFNISSEDAKVRESYGNTQAGQRLLMARRLIEAGTRYVTVTYGSWDHHDNIQGAMQSNMPALDKALSQLIADLDDRGLLSETLVLVTSEFGRTPKINNTAGRDHWPRVFSTFMAGGPIKQGVIYGASDSLGGDVDENPVSPGDISATLFNLLGINHEKTLMTSDLRPVVISEGRVIAEIIS